MLDLFAAIQSADPPSLVLWSLFVFAAGMYPIGFMLGSTCSPCCGNPCTLCTTGSLPDTVTVTFDGFTDQTPGPDLISLSFSACFGGGASARVTAPGGDPDTDKGPISAVSLTNAGSGYAKLGRVAPTVSVSGGSGTGATFTPTITSSNDACGVPSWSIASVAVKAGTGYVDGEQLTVTIADGDTEATAASVIVNTTRTQPTLTASASPGSGAVLSVTLSENYGSPTTWGVASVSVTNGGTGYTDGDTLTFAGGSATKVNEEASAYIYTGRSTPTLSGGAAIPGSGAVLTPTLTEYTDWSGRPYWSVTAFTITNAGTGYSEFDQVFITVTDGTVNPWSPFSGYVSSVDENGAITGITIDYGGEFYKDTGVIQSVEVWYGGSYYDDDGVPTGVTVSNGGLYYREDASASPYVATVTTTISSVWPSTGSGAVITGVVDDDTSSATFGQLSGLTIDDGGDDYLAHELLGSCLSRFQGRPIVCKKSDTNRCLYEFKCARPACTAEEEAVYVRYLGPTTPVEVEVYTRVTALDWSVIQGGSPRPEFVSATGFMRSVENVPDCSVMSFECEPLSGVPSGSTASVSPGGTYAETETCLQLPADKLDDVHVSIEWAGNSWEGAVDGNQCGSNSWFGWYFDNFPEPGKAWILQCGITHLAIKGCRLVWSPLTVVGQYVEQRTSFPFSIIKQCGWEFTIVEIPVDEEGFPSGNATVVAGGTNPQNSYGDCEYPGLPEITFSRLP